MQMESVHIMHILHVHVQCTLYMIYVHVYVYALQDLQAQHPILPLLRKVSLVPPPPSVH